MEAEEDFPSYSRPTPARQLDEPFDRRIETLLTLSMEEDVIFAYKAARCRSRMEWLREIIVKELYGVQGLQRLRDGLSPDNPEGSR